MSSGKMVKQADTEIFSVIELEKREKTKTVFERRLL